MMKLRKKGNNKGSTMVIVILAVAFIAIIAATTILAALMNLQMKVVDRNSKKAFYTAEEAVDEVYAGLGKVSIGKLSETYSDVLSSVTGTALNGSASALVVLDNTACNKKLRDNYLRSMVATLVKGDFDSVVTGITNTTNYTTPVLLDEATAAASATSNVAFIDNLNSYIENPDRNVIKVKKVDSISVLAHKDNDLNNYTIIAKGCDIFYKSSKDGYYSDIIVDIEIGLPDGLLSFMNNSTSSLTSYEDYALIGCTGIQVSSGTGVSINNTKAYAGCKTTTSGTGLAAITTKFGGFRTIGNGTSVKLTNSALVSGADVLIGETQSTLASSAPIAQSSNNSLEADDLSRIWAENIKTPSNSSASKIKIDGTAFVADDLDIDGKGANVNISGNYIGFGNQGYSATAATNDHATSSAIMLNGENANLDMSSITSLILGGRAYIDLKSSAHYAAASSSYYATGESIALRGGQEAYLIPDSMIKDRTNENKHLSNPMSALKDYNATNVYADIPVDYFGTAYANLDENGKAKVKVVTSGGFTYMYLDIKTGMEDEYISALLSSDDSYAISIKKRLLAGVNELNQSIKTNNTSKVYTNSALMSTSEDNTSVSVQTGNITSSSSSAIATDKVAMLAAIGRNRYELLNKLLYEPPYYTDNSNISGSAAYTDKASLWNDWSTMHYSIVVRGKSIDITNQLSSGATIFSNFVNETYLTNAVSSFYKEIDNVDTNIKDIVYIGNDQATKAVYIGKSASDCNNFKTANNITNIKTSIIGKTGGIVVTTGDVYVDQGFNGVILSRGNIYIYGTNDVFTNTQGSITDLLNKLSDADAEEARKYFTAWNTSTFAGAGSTQNLEYKSVEGLTYKDLVNFEDWHKGDPVSNN